MLNTEIPIITLRKYISIVQAVGDVHQARCLRARQAIESTEETVLKIKDRYNGMVDLLKDPHSLASNPTILEGLKPAAISVEAAEHDHQSALDYNKTIYESRVEQLLNQEWPVSISLFALLQALLNAREADFAKTDLPVAATEILPTTTKAVFEEALTDALPEGSLRPTSAVSVAPAPSKEIPQQSPETKPIEASAVAFDWTPITQTGLNQRQVSNDLIRLAEQRWPHLLPQERIKGRKIDFTQILAEIRKLTFRDINQIYGDDNRRFDQVQRLADLLIRTASLEPFAYGQLPDGYQDWLTASVSCFREETSDRRGVDCRNFKYKKDEVVGEKLNEVFTEWQKKGEKARNCASVKPPGTPATVTQPTTAETTLTTPTLPTSAEATAQQPQRLLSWDILLGATGQDSPTAKRAFDDVLRKAREALPDKPWTTADNGKSGTAFRLLHEPTIQILSGLTIEDVIRAFPAVRGKLPTISRTRLVLLIYLAQYQTNQHKSEDKPPRFNNNDLVAVSQLLVANPATQGATITEQINSLLAQLEIPTPSQPEAQPEEPATPVAQSVDLAPKPSTIDEKPKPAEAYQPPEDLPVDEEGVRQLIDFTVREWCGSAKERGNISANHLLIGLTTAIIARVDGTFTHTLVDKLARAGKLKMYGRQKHGGEVTYTAESFLWQWLLYTHYSKRDGTVIGERLCSGLWKKYFDEVLTKYLAEQEKPTNGK